MAFKAAFPVMPSKNARDVDTDSVVGLTRLNTINLFGCRLCWQIALIVIFCIVAIEAAILIPSYVNYERDLLKKLEDVGLASVRVGFAQREVAAGAGLRAAGARLLESPEVTGLAIYGVDGELVGTLGETPGLTLIQARQHGVNSLRSQDGNRLSAAYRSARTDLPFDVIAHLDASRVSDKLTAFVWRIVGLVFLITFFVSSATLLMVGLWVLRPMLKIREKLVAVQKDPREADSFALHHPKKDEVGDMVDALNALMKHLSDYRHSELLAKEARFRDFADVSSDWFWEMDAQLRFSFFSERFTEITGVPHEALLGKTRQETGLPGVPDEEWRQHLADLAAHRSFRDFRHPRRNSNGETTYLSVNGKAVFSEDGAFRGYRGTGSDITRSVVAEEALQRSYGDLEILVGKRTAELERLNEQLRAEITEREVAREELREAYGVLQRETEERERAEEAIRTRDAWLRAILDNAPIQIALKDTDCRLMAVSRNTATEMGLDQSEFVGRTTADFLPPEIAEHYMAADREVMATGEPRQQAVTEDRDGQIRHWLNSKFPLRDDQGQIAGVCSLSSDITEMKEAEARLAQAQKMEAVGQLTGGVAHDFNNLLAVIQGNAELLAEEIGPENPMMQSVIRASRRGSELTHRLLAFSRQQSLRPQSTNLAGLVGSMNNLLKRTLGETIEVETRAKDDLAHVIADPGQLENALLNLAINARDAMPEGGKLTIECENVHLDDIHAVQNPEALAGDYVVLAVSDTGTGMSPEIQQHVFEPFFTTKEVGRGSGLGLSMVYGFAKQSGGQVTIYSEPDRGTTVKIYLPQAAEEAQDEAKSQSGPIPQGRGETILVIEDDADLRELAANALERLDYRTICVADAPSASATLAGGEMPDLVLSDVVLPGGISGPEFAETASALYPDLKVIFMSGYPVEAAKRSGTLGADKVLLNKPFQIQQLAVALREALA